MFYPLNLQVLVIFDPYNSKFHRRTVHCTNMYIACCLFMSVIDLFSFFQPFAYELVMHQEEG